MKALDDLITAQAALETVEFLEEITETAKIEADKIQLAQRISETSNKKAAVEQLQLASESLHEITD